MAELCENLERKFSSEETLSYPFPEPRVVDLAKISRGKEIGALLCNACENGHVKMIKAILETNNIDVNATFVHADISQKLGTYNNSEYTPLMIAAAYDRIDLVNFLLKQTGLNVWRNGPCTALSLALHLERNCERLNYDMIHNLMAAGADINQWLSLTGVPPLLTAWYKGNQEVANKLVFLGASIRRSRLAQESDYFSRPSSALKNFPQQLELSRKYLSELSNACWLGIDIVRFELPEDIKLKVVDFLFHKNSPFVQVFTVGNDLMNGLLCKRKQLLQSVALAPQRAAQEQISQIPKPLTFMRTRQSEIFNQKWVNEYKGQNQLSNRKKDGYGPGVMDM